MKLFQVTFIYFGFIFESEINARKYNTIKVNIERSTAWTPTVIDKTCMLTPDPGPCRAGIPMYYYDPSTKNCSTFDWGGCQGNGNRFDTWGECITRCLSQPNPKNKRPNWCDLTFDYGFCFGALKRWYYDPLWKNCKERIYSGCGGNKNNFYNKEQCDAICKFGKNSLRENVILTRATKYLIVNPKT